MTAAQTLVDELSLALTLTKSDNQPTSVAKFLIREHGGHERAGKIFAS
jgi:hypothetical protein